MEEFADASWCVQPVLVGMDCLVLEGDSHPSVHLVHQMLGVRGGHVEIFGGLGLEL